MAIFIKTLFNIITDRKETVYTFRYFFLIVGLPAKPFEMEWFMMEYTSHLNQIDLQEHMEQVFGTGYIVADCERLHGGAQKVVYKLRCTNGFICMLYVWDLTMNYFQSEIENEQPTEHSYSAASFELNHHFLRQVGIQTPAYYYINKEKDRYPFEYALVEYINGGDAASYFTSDAEVQDRVFSKLGDMLARMHGNERTAYGKLATEDVSTEQCHLAIMDNAIQQLAYASQYIDSISVNQGRVLDLIKELESKIEPRNRYGFVHGELGPDHVFIDNKFEPYLIDIEGALFFDIEHEHSFLEFRFGSHYRYLRNDTLDRARMKFYKLYHHISCTSGGLKLLHRGFPNQQLAKEIVEYNYRSVLESIDEMTRD